MSHEMLTPETVPAGPRWMSRLVEVLQPLSVRADRLGSTRLFAGLQWSDLEHAAACLSETLVERGTRMTVQGQPSSRLWLIARGQALVSADARPLRVAGTGDAVGGTTMLYKIESPTTTIALTSITAFEAGPSQMRDLIAHPAIRRRLDLIMRSEVPTVSLARRPTRLRSLAGA
jgi:CRP-like cAMP-binding protein